MSHYKSEGHRTDSVIETATQITGVKVTTHSSHDKTTYLTSEAVFQEACIQISYCLIQLICSSIFCYHNYLSSQILEYELFKYDRELYISLCLDYLFEHLVPRDDSYGCSHILNIITSQ